MMRLAIAAWGSKTVRALLASAITVLVAILPAVVVAQEAGAAADALVVHVQSGNTIDVQLADGSTQRVRMLGVNAPRIDAPGIGDECYGPEAAAFLADRVAGKLVRLEQEVSDRDASGRLLRHVWMWDADAGAEIFVGRLLVSEGYAEVLSDLRTRSASRTR